MPGGVYDQRGLSVWSAGAFSQYDGVVDSGRVGTAREDTLKGDLEARNIRNERDGTFEAISVDYSW